MDMQSSKQCFTFLCVDFPCAECIIQNKNDFNRHVVQLWAHLTKTFDPAGLSVLTAGESHEEGSSCNLPGDILYCSTIQMSGINIARDQAVLKYMTPGSQAISISNIGITGLPDTTLHVLVRRNAMKMDIPSIFNSKFKF